MHYIKLLKKLLAIPLLALFFLTTEQTLILSDVRRWTKIRFEKVPKSSSDLINLLRLLATHKEFRNLYYYRIFQGNTIAVLGLYLAKIFYKEAPVLFIRKSCKIGPGLFIQHGFSTTINANIGEHCWVNQQVTIGIKGPGRPTLRNHVRISAGAKVLGNVTLGDNVIVGANAVVTKDVPANCVVVGVPAYIIKKNGKRVKEQLV